MNSDRKMLKESDAILTGTLNQLVKDEPDVVMISGDLTKDGEQVNHEAVAEKLSEAKDALKKKGVDTNFLLSTAITTSTILTEKVFLPKRHRTQTEQL